MTRTRLPSLAFTSVIELPSVLATKRWLPSETSACGSLNWYCVPEKAGSRSEMVPGPAGPGSFQVIALVEAGQPDPSTGMVTARELALTQAWIAVSVIVGAPDCGSLVTVS